MALKPFGASPSCPKCGRSRPSTYWHFIFPFGDPPAKAKYWPCTRSDVGGEHLCLICEGCGYGFMMATRDAPAGG
jgi:hypothetical protein